MDATVTAAVLGWTVTGTGGRTGGWAGEYWNKIQARAVRPHRAGGKKTPTVQPNPLTFNPNRNPSLKSPTLKYKSYLVT